MPGSVLGDPKPVRWFYSGPLTICIIAVLVACGASGNSGSPTTTTTPPLTVTIKVTGAAPSALASQVDGGAWSSLTINGSSGTFTVPSARSNYAVAVRCPFSSTANPNEQQLVIEANASDIAVPTFTCPPTTLVA